jgi:hypothetical protein
MIVLAARIENPDEALWMTLRDRWQAEPPREAKDVVAMAIETWRVSPDAVIDWNVADVPDGRERLGVPGMQE